MSRLLFCGLLGIHAAACYDFDRFERRDLAGLDGSTATDLGIEDGAVAPDVAPPACPPLPGVNLLTAATSTLDVGVGGWLVAYGSAIAATSPCQGMAAAICDIQGSNQNNFSVLAVAGAPQLIRYQARVWVRLTNPAQTQARLDMEVVDANNTSLVATSSLASVAVPDWQQLETEIVTPSPPYVGPLAVWIGVNLFWSTSMGCLELDQASVVRLP